LGAGDREVRCRRRRGVVPTPAPDRREEEETEIAALVAVLAVLGGCGRRSRPGLHIERLRMAALGSLEAIRETGLA